MKQYDDKICRYALHRIFGYHPVTALALLERYGSGEAIFSMGCRRIADEVGAGYRNIDRINDREYEEAEREYGKITVLGARFLTEDDPHYPALLKECRDRPIGLFVRSESSDEEIFGGGRRFIAVVGTRDLSLYGSEWCSRIIGALAECEESPTIVSGLALGTDITAHRKALSSGLPTIAILPTGIDEIYPRRHYSDADRIIGTPGCAIITDYPPGTAPLQLNFLRRNRIIAGICEATILIESKIRGGGMMTARLASSYFRDLYALPGRIGDLRSQGCNLLIKDKLAEPIISAESLVDSLGLTAAEKREQTDDEDFVSDRFSGRMSAEWIEKLAAVLTAVRNSDGADIEQISRQCMMEYREAAQLVAILEGDGLVNVDIMQRCSINYR
ncbi:MAG: DNA-protecting protein DprA [Bacteroidales bacterium]|nr:DNA-protecting protein DprA [Bacteroidales bacterium]